jgi:hypothetical protein
MTEVIASAAIRNFFASQSTTGPTQNLTDSEGKAGFTLWVAPLGIGPDFNMYNGAGKLGCDGDKADFLN